MIDISVKKRISLKITKQNFFLLCWYAGAENSEFIIFPNKLDREKRKRIFLTNENMEKIF